MNEGDRVRLTRDVERFPHFIAPQGSTGVVVQLEADEAAVHLDERLEGAAEWGNRVLWTGDHRGEFQEDVSVVDES